MIVLRTGRGRSIKRITNDEQGLKIEEVKKFLNRKSLILVLQSSIMPRICKSAICLDSRASSKNYADHRSAVFRDRSSIIVHRSSFILPKVFFRKSVEHLTKVLNLSFEAAAVVRIAGHADAVGDGGGHQAAGGSDPEAFYHRRDFFT